MHGGLESEENAVEGCLDETLSQECKYYLRLGLSFINFEWGTGED
jgi:hypothetical protein